MRKNFSDEVIVQRTAFHSESRIGPITSASGLSAIRQEFAELIGGGQQSGQSGKGVVGTRL